MPYWQRGKTRAGSFPQESALNTTRELVAERVFPIKQARRRPLLLERGLNPSQVEWDRETFVSTFETRVFFIIKIKEEEEMDKINLESYRHTAAHVMAQAVKRLYSNVKLGIGPAIEDGFYYDFDLEERINPEDLSRIEEEMKKIIKENLPLEREILSREEARELLEKENENYKLELLEELEPGEEVSIYRQGDFFDLCRGPHLERTGQLKAFKLLSVAGAYWRGDEKNKMLQRIYGTAFPDRKELKQYLYRLEEAKKRDHRKIGKELDLFSMHEEGPGFPFLHPAGVAIWNELTRYWRELHRANGYQEIRTPLILNEELWHQSGHWDNYRENMYFTRIDEDNYAIRPMNCPGGVLIYKSRPHSYREFPMRVTELGLVHRHELSGVLHGLLRVRSFHIDDAHIYMLPEQVTDEVLGVIRLAEEIYNTFGLKYRLELSTRPEKSMGSDEDWDQAEKALASALKKRGLPYQLNEGDGAFYGPKIDFHIEDCLGRSWQLGTIQLDFQLPQRFDLTYVGRDGQEHRPVLLHRALFGALERFLGIITEHFAGAFPTWLAPVQARFIPIGENHVEYARKLCRELENEGIRAEVDERDEKVGYKIRQAQKEKVPYMLAIGDREMEAEKVSLRHRQKGEAGQFDFSRFKEELQKEVKERKLESFLDEN